MSRWHCFESKDDGQQVWDEDDDALLDDRDRDDEPPAEDDPRQTVERPTPKTGRNEPCPCGSGKKYKKCCGR
jgi:preprotein translocase subunit SecA